MIHYMIFVKLYKSLSIRLTILFKYLGIGLEDEFCTTVNKKRRIDKVFVGKTKVLWEPKKNGGKGKNVVKDIPVE